MSTNGFENREKDGCNGFTLVEVIIVVAIMSMVILAITMMMSTSTRIYRRESQDIDLQQEAQSSMNQLEDMIVSANQLRFVYYHTGASDETTVIDYEAIDEGNTKQHYFIIWIKANNSLYFVVKDSAFTYNGSDSEVTELVANVTEDVNLMAKNINTFEAKYTDEILKQSVTVNAEFKIRPTDSNSYTIIKQIKLRNKQS